MKHKLQEFNVKYTLAYLDKLRFRWKGKNLSLTMATAANKFITDNCSDHGEGAG